MGADQCVLDRHNVLRLRSPATYLRSNIVATLSSLVLARYTAAAQIEYTSGGKGVFFGYQPCHHGCDLIEFEKTSTQNLGQHVVKMFLRHLIEDSRACRRRSNAVDCDIDLPVLSLTTWSARSARFRSALSGGVGISFLTRDRSHVDDPGHTLAEP